MGTKRQLRVVTSWDDGHQLDFKVHDLLLKHGMPGIFYVPTFCGLSMDDIRTLASSFEIGGHTTSHPADLKLLPPEVLIDEVSDNRRYLQDISNQEVTSFCYPRGRYDRNVISAVRIAGFTNARTTVVLEIAAKDQMQTPTTIHVYPRKEYGNRDWFELAQLFANKASWEGGTFHLWGHSWEVEKLGHWGRLEELLLWLNEEFEIQK